MAETFEGWRFAVFLGGLVLALGAETLWRARPWHDGRLKRLAFHGALAAFNSVVMRLTAVGPLLAWSAYVSERGWGLAPALGLHGAPEILVSLVLCDFGDYWMHRWNHVVPLFWRFHKVHHADTHVDAITSLRFHLTEFWLSHAYKAVWILAVGPSALAFALFEAGITLASQFHHSNVDLPDRAERFARLFTMTPRLHAAHHTATLRSRDANYATIFRVWDVLFGTVAEADAEELKTLGLTRGRDVDLAVLPTLRAPFTDEY